MRFRDRRTLAALTHTLGTGGARGALRLGQDDETAERWPEGGETRDERRACAGDSDWGQARLKSMKVFTVSRPVAGLASMLCSPSMKALCRRLP